MWLYDQIVEQYKGGPGSGNWGHAGVKGNRGGSAPKRGMGAGMSLATGPTSKKRQEAAREAGKKAKETAILDAEKVTDDYFIATPSAQKGKKAIEWKQVEGKPVRIKGLLDQDLFIHKMTSRYGQDLGWQISEARTGSAIGSPHRTQREAKAVASETIARIGADTFKDRMRRYVETSAIRDGIIIRSPRYGGKKKLAVGKVSENPNW